MRFVRKTHYAQDINLAKHRGHWLWYGLLLSLLLVLPLLLDRFYLGELAQVFIYAIAGIGLMLLVGYTGQVSLGHAAFLAIGAYTHTILLGQGLPLPVSLLLATLLSAGIGALVGIPALRMTGIYLAVATLAFAVIVEQVTNPLDLYDRWFSRPGGAQSHLCWGQPGKPCRLLLALSGGVNFGALVCPEPAAFANRALVSRRARL